MLVLSQSGLEEFEELSTNYKLFLAKNPSSSPISVNQPYLPIT